MIRVSRAAVATVCTEVTRCVVKGACLLRLASNWVSRSQISRWSTSSFSHSFSYISNIPPFTQKVEELAAKASLTTQTPSSVAVATFGPKPTIAAAAAPECTTQAQKGAVAGKCSQLTTPVVMGTSTGPPAPRETEGVVAERLGTTEERRSVAGARFSGEVTGR